MLGWAQRWLQDMLTSAIGQFVDVRENFRFSLRSGVSMSNVSLRCRAVERIPGLKLPVAIESGEIEQLQLQIPWMNLIYGKIVLKVSGVEVVFRERSEWEWEGELARARAEAQKQALLGKFEIELLARALQESRDGESARADGFGEGFEEEPSARGKKSTGSFNFGSLTTSLLSKVGKVLLAKLVICVENVHIQYQDSSHLAKEDDLEQLDAITANLMRSSSYPTSAEHLPAEDLTEEEEEDVKVFGLRLSRLESIQEDSRLSECSPTTVVTLSELSIYTCSVQSTERSKSGMFASTSAEGGNAAGTAQQNILEPMSCTISVNVYHGDQESSNPDFYDVRCQLNHVHLNIDNELLRALIVVVDKLEIWELRSLYGRFRPARWRTLASGGKRTASAGSSAGSQWAKQGWKYALAGVLQGINSRHSKAKRLKNLRLKYPYSYGKYIELYKQRLIQLASGQKKRHEVGFVNFLEEFEEKEDVENILALRSHVGNTMGADWLSRVHGQDSKSVQDSVLSSFWSNWMTSDKDSTSPTENNFSKLEEIYDKLVEQMPRTPRASNTSQGLSNSEVVCRLQLGIGTVEMDVSDRANPLMQVGISDTQCRLEVLESNVTKASMRARAMYLKAGESTIVRQMDTIGDEDFLDLNVEILNVGEESHLSLKVSCIVRPLVCSIPPDEAIERLLAFEVPTIETYHLSWLLSANQLESRIARSHAKAQYLMQYPYVNFQLILSEVCFIVRGESDESLVFRARGASVTSARHDVLESSSKARLALHALKNNIDSAPEMVEEHVMYHRLNCTVAEVDVELARDEPESRRLHFQDKLMSTSLWTEVELLLLPDDKTQAVCKANVDFSNLKIKVSSLSLRESLGIVSHNMEKLSSFSSHDKVSPEIDESQGSSGSLIEVRVRLPSVLVDLHGFQGIPKPLRDHLRLAIKGLKAGVQSNLVEDECFVSICSIKLEQKTGPATYTLLNLSLQELIREIPNSPVRAPESSDLYKNASSSFEKVTPEKKGKQLFKGTLNEKTWISSSLSFAMFEKKDEKDEKTVVFNAFCARINTRLIECALNVTERVGNLFDGNSSGDCAPEDRSRLIEAQRGPSSAIAKPGKKVTIHVTVTNYKLETDVVGGEELCLITIPKMNLTMLTIADQLKSVEMLEEALSVSLRSSKGNHLLVEKFDVSTKLTFHQQPADGAGRGASTALDLWINVPQLEISLHEEDTKTLYCLFDTFSFLDDHHGRGEGKPPQQSTGSAFPSVINVALEIKFLQCEIFGRQKELGSIVGLSEELYVQVNLADSAISSFECGWRFLGLFMSTRDKSCIPSRILLASLQPKQHGNEIPIIETNAHSGNPETMELLVKNVQVNINAFCWDKFFLLIDQIETGGLKEVDASGEEQGPAAPKSGRTQGYKCFAEDLEISINFEDYYEVKSPPVLIRTKLEFALVNEFNKRRVDLEVNHLLLDVPLKGLEEDENGELSSFKTFAFFDDLSLTLSLSEKSVDGFVDLGSLSLWVSHQNLSFLNMALSSFKDKSAEDSGEAKEKDSSSEVSIDIAFTSKKFAALFSDDRFQRDSPIAEIAVYDIRTKYAADPSSLTECSVNFKTVVDFYNYDKVAWEPVVEEWPLQIYYQSSDRSNSRRKVTPSHKLMVQSKSQWNINVSEYTIETANILRQMLESLKMVSGTEVCTPRITSAKFTPYWLQNQTGLNVGYCFTDGSSSSADLSELRNKEEGQAPDENLVPLYIRKSSGRGGRHVSYKHMSKKIAARRSLVVSQNNDQRWVSGRRPVIHFKIRGSTWSESVAMNTYAKHRISLENVEGMNHKKVDVLCDVQRRANGGRLIVLHSCISITNSCGFCIQVGSCSPLALEPNCIRTLVPGESFWVPLQISLTGSVCLRMILDSDEHTAWSQRMNLDQFVRGKNKEKIFLGNCIRGSKGAVLSFIIFTDRDGSHFKLRVEPPVKVRNWLPVPLDSVLYRGDKQLLKSNIDPDSSLNIHNVRNSNELSLFLRPRGYNWGESIGIPFSCRKEDLDRGGASPAVRESSVVLQGSDGDDGAKIALEVKYVGNAPMILQISCPLRIYNHTGLNLGVRDRGQESSFQQVLPYGGESDVPDLVGLGSMVSGKLESEPVGLGLFATFVDDEDGGDKQKFGSDLLAYEKSPRSEKQQACGQQWPTMFGLKSYRNNVRLQLRVKPDPRVETVMTSKIFNVDVLGEPTVVEVGTSEGQQSSRRPKAYFFTVSTEISTFGGSSIGVHIRPRFILTNKLDKEIMYRQEGTKIKHTLKAGGSQAIHADVASETPKLCVKLEDNAVWSGYFHLDKPGGIQMKMTGSGQEESMMLQVDVRELSFETWTISISEYQAGFAPYRIDNFTSDILSYFQQNCEPAEGMLKPYSSAVYTWDEPYMSHKLVIKLPGYGNLGSFALDKVGSVHVVSVPVHTGAHLNRNVSRNLQIATKADGPTRVLSISDLSIHMPRRDTSRLPLSNKLMRMTKMDKKTTKEDVPPAQEDSVYFLDIQVSHLGLSVIGKSSEILYLSMLDLQLKFEGGEERDVVTFKTRRIQIDNMLPNAALPVLLSIPAPLYQQDTISSASDGILFKLSYWHANVANIMCVESAVVKVPPILLDMDGSIFLRLHHFSEVLSWVEETSSLTRVSSASSMNGKEEESPGYRLHFECIKISPIHITVSLSTAGLTSGETFTLSENPKGVNAQLLYALTFAEFEGVKVLLSGFELNHAFIDKGTLQWLLGKHYIKALLKEAVKILGSANVLGDPLGLVQHLGTGMWDFLSKPAVGLLQSALTLGVGQFTAGLSAGSWSLLSHTVYALSNAAWKISKTAHRNVNVVKTRCDMIINSSLPLHKHIDKESNPSMIGAVSRGIGGLIAAPIHGMEQNGLKGLVEGTTFGVLGAIASPTVTLLEFAQHTSKVLRDVAKSGILKASRMRPPRKVSEDLPLSSYMLNEALGNLLLATVSNGRFKREEQMFSCLLDNACCILVTTKHVMSVRTTASYDFTVEWLYSLGDIIEQTREGSKVTLTVLLPLQHISSVNDNLNLEPSFGLPICQKQVDFPTQSDAEVFEDCLACNEPEISSPSKVPLLTMTSASEERNAL
ncbi:vacuolar protein sorting-associated protein [Chloropicon primus]|nr:vacuolar protein sorting-associated protein [Chloropicon primus]